jgi:hypothetical protein
MLTQQEILKEVFTLPPSEQREIAEKIEKLIEQSNGKEDKNFPQTKKKRRIFDCEGIENEKPADD